MTEVLEKEKVAVQIDIFHIRETLKEIMERGPIWEANLGVEKKDINLPESTN
jgi:hypothetical protein